MTPHTIPQTVLFPDLFEKPLVAAFKQEQASSDGGAVLLKAAERVYGFVKAFAAAWLTGAHRGRFDTRLRICSASGSSASRAAIPTATTPTIWPTTPSTSCCSGGTR